MESNEEKELLQQRSSPYIIRLRYSQILLLPQLTIEFSACPAVEIRRQKALKYPHIPAAFFLGKR